MEPWNDETIKILNNVRINSLNLSDPYNNFNFFVIRNNLSCMTFR